MPFRKRSKSLDHFDVRDENRFKPQRVVSFQLFAKEQISRLTTYCPFLTQEQIALKVKDKWNHMADDAKQSYTKAVIFGTPSRKSPGKKSKPTPESLKQHELKLPMKDKIVNSNTKVSDWLNDVKRKRSKDVDKTYESSSYALQYDVPTVIDPTPSKQPGILKTGSSEKKENKKSDGKAGRQSRVSFSNGDEKLNEGASNKKSKTKLESKFSNIVCSDKFDDETTSRGIKKSENSSDKQDSLKERNGTSSSHLKGIVFEEKVEDELFTTPEMIKLSLEEISKAPRKRKNSYKEQKTSSKSSKAKKMKVTDKNKEEKTLNNEKEAADYSKNTNNKSNTEFYVFGKKPWAASTYSRKAGSKRFTPEKAKERKPACEGEQNSKRKGGALVGPILRDSDENYDEYSEDFLRDEGGLMVGPNGFRHEEDIEEEQICDDHSEVEPEDKKNDHPQIWKTKGKSHQELSAKKQENKKKTQKTRTNRVLKKKSPPKRKVPKEKTPQQRKVLKVKSPPKKTFGRKTVYQSDFVFEENSKDQLKQTEEEDSMECEKTMNPKKTRNKLHLKIQEESPAGLNSNSESESVNGSLPYRSQLVSLCKDFSVEKPISPVISDAGDSNISNATEKSSPVRLVGGSNPTLMKVLLKMKQIASPNILDLGEEESPKLLSPTVSGISELSSLSTTSTVEDTKVKSFKNQQGKNLLKTTKSPASLSSYSSKRPQKSSRQPKGQENLLCSMFQDLTPPEMKKVSKRRFVSSNRIQENNNFSGMFEDEDIF